MSANTIQKSRINTRKIAMTAVMAAVATVLMFISFKLPFMPSFISLDFSELPALIASFTLGPLSGVAVCFVKNLVNLTQSMTGGVGELSNFIIGSAFVLPAGLIYKKHRNLAGAAIGSVLGALFMAVLGLFSNYFIVYPIYTNLMPMEAIMGMYQAINPSVENLWQALIVFNLPFTFCKGLISAVVTLLVYKKLEPVINGKVL
ncbi:ECF transporter S component [Anaeromassilibacillus senegalensis]|uniref:Riboflavin transporter n=1 Tax=Anaeromassilibacillus senegalensis TaxID=1673717 RepID=A0ABS9CLQ0_9FIRM|nr:ECF transporter S component [Anaeromassilibacillus senegalensis]MCF2652059.1 ECF transporter S component [Anaeromassilibacillus senegalensis]MCI5650720.1 ECF transporter S component [Ruminococcus bromii]